MKIRIQDIDINLQIEGNPNGPWITLSHSLACNLHMWDEQIALLSKDFHILRFDTRGHGLSSAPPGPYSLDQMAQDVASVFSAIGITQSHWLGLSMGGMIGQTFALQYPGVLQTLALADTTSKRPANAEAMWGQRIKVAREQGMLGVLPSTLERWFTTPFRLTRLDVMERISEGILSTPVEGFCGACAAIAKVDTFDELTKITCPTLIMVGEDDHGTPPEMALAMHQQLAHSELAIIANAGHLSNVEQAQAFNEILWNFLKDNALAQSSVLTQYDGKR